MQDIDVVLIQRICPNYRVPVYRRLSREFSFHLLYGKGGKSGFTRNAKDISGFDSRRLLSFGMEFHLHSRSHYVSFTPGLFIHLFRMNPDVIITEGTTNFIDNIQVVIYCILARKPFIWWDAGKLPDTKNSILRILLEPFVFFLMRKAAALVVYGGMARDFFLKKGVPEEIIFVAQNTSDFLPADEDPRVIEERIRKIKERLSLRGRKILLNVGSMEKRRCLPSLVKAFTEIKVNVPDASLIFIGDGPDKASIEALAANSGTDDIILLGRIDDDLGDYFRMCDIVVFPGWSTLAVLQGMAYGKAVVTSPRGGPEYEIMEDGKNGFFVEHGNVQQLTSVIIKLLTDEALRKRIGEAALKKYREAGSIENMVGQISKAVSYACRNPKRIAHR